MFLYCGCYVGYIEICIVSDDKGRISLKPEINLFEKYKESHNIKVLNYDEWLNVFGTMEQPQIS
jgi:hypothetical protein